MPNELQHLVAINMRRERQRLNISQDELADRCGLHRTYVGGVERGERNITLASLERIALALGIPPTELLLSRGPDAQTTKGPKGQR